LVQEAARGKWSEKMNQCLVVFCRMPGRWRAGMQHPQIAEYPLDHFSAAQLAEIRRDEAFSFAMGEVASAPMIDQLMGVAFEREHAAAAKEAALASGPVAPSAGAAPTHAAQAGKKAKGAGA
jgi:hypothetical protein